MIALVHQGEMLIPAGPAATFRRMMGGSSGVACTVHGHHLLAGEPCADSGLIAVLIDIRELGDRSSYMDAGILCILGSALWIVSTPNLWCGHS